MEIRLRDPVLVGARRVTQLALGLLVLGSGPALAQDAAPASAELSATPAEPSAPECMSLPKAIRDIVAAVDDIEFEQATELSREAVRALECQPEKVSATLLTSLLQVVGTVHRYNGKNDEAREVFFWAVVSSPTTALPATYGSESVAIYQQIQDEALTAPPGSLMVTGQVEAWLNGTDMVVGQKVPVAPGKHLLQWREASEQMQGRVIQIMEAEPRSIPLGPQGPVTPVTVASAPVPAPGAGVVPRSPLSKQKVMLGGGAASAVVGAILLSMAAQNHGDFDDATDPSTLDDLQSRGNKLASVGFGLTAAGLGMTGASFLLDGGQSYGMNFSWNF